MSWIVLIYRLPSNDSRARVAVRRELRRSGALHVQQSVVAVPDGEAFADDVRRLRDVLDDVGGQVIALRSEPFAGGDDVRLLEAWNAARNAEHRELTGECVKFLAELDEEEAELEKLQRWHERIRRLDVYGAAGGPAAVAIWNAEQALARYSEAVFERTQP